jgi:hypothetical protein
VQLVGDMHQGCPNLVLDQSNHPFVDASRFHKAGDRLHATDTRVIAEYLAARYGAMVPHY